jgi:hypothetical protein
LRQAVAAHLPVRAGYCQRVALHSKYKWLRKELVMADRGHVFRRAFSWLPAQFASQSDTPVGAPRRFGSTEHLSIEAIVAFVDGELRMTAHLRAAHHLSLCPLCAAEVEGQSRARAALRDSHPIRIPTELLGLLSEIPHYPPDDEASPSDRFAEGDARDQRKRR